MCNGHCDLGDRGALTKRSRIRPVPMVTVLAGISDHWVVCDMSKSVPRLASATLVDNQNDRPIDSNDAGRPRSRLNGWQVVLANW